MRLGAASGCGEGYAENIGSYSAWRGVARGAAAGAAQAEDLKELMEPAEARCRG